MFANHGSDHRLISRIRRALLKLKSKKELYSDMDKALQQTALQTKVHKWPLRPSAMLRVTNGEVRIRTPATGAAALRSQTQPPESLHTAGTSSVQSQQRGREDRERPHQPQGGRAGRLRGAVQNQETHPAEQADEGVLREAGLVNEADQVQV